jgi:methyl-accepting chemotaxis protein
MKNFRSIKMNILKKSISIKTKLLLIIVIMMTGLLAVSSYALYAEKSSLLKERELKTRHLVETAYGVLEYQYDLQSKGTVTEEQAKTAAMSIIRALRYEKNEYFWINDMFPRVLMHPMKPELEGKDVSDFKDPNGKRLYVEIVNTVKKDGSGFVDYYWKRTGSTDPSPKISYVKEFTPWGWVIGSGIYIDDLDVTFWNSVKQMLIILGVLTLVLLSLLQMITRSITHPLLEAVKIADAVAKGDLTQHIEVKSSDEVGQLLQALKEMNESLAGIVGEVRGTTESITTASREIAQGNNDLSQRTEQQAASLEETASSMEELTSTVKQNTENARHANQLAGSASDIAVKGGQVVNEVVDTMASINTSSKKIVDIISVIEGIAFQTNILALNAAVEAARAGEQGRGFAVVAGEVRNLAQRSAAAAKEIKVLIGDSVDKVDIGSKQVDQAGATMNEIVTAVKRVTDIMAEIAAASDEQSAGIEQVNQAIMQMDNVTQQNAALVEEAAAAAESMQGQTEVLMNAVSIFKLGTGRAMKPATVARPAIVHRTPQHVPAVPVKRQRQLVKVKADRDEEWQEF